MSARAPFPSLPRGLGLRQRRRADGSWRVWWEPTPDERARGAAPVDLDADRPTWSSNQAKTLRKRFAGDAPGKAGSGGRTVQALIETYQRSPQFAALKPATQADYRQAFGVIGKKWGGQLVTAFTRPVIYTWYETIHSQTPTYAGALVRKFSVLFTYAELIGWRPENSNPCLKIRPQAAEARERFATWAEFDALLAAADVLGWPGMRAAIALAVYSAQRSKDIREAQRGAFASLADAGGMVWVWNLRRSKRGNLGSVPLHEDLAQILAPALAGNDPAAPLVIDDITGEAFTKDTLARRWRVVRDRAATGPATHELHAHYQGSARLPDAALHPCPSLLRPVLQFRDLRRTFGVWAREGGASREDVGDVLGNNAATNGQLAQIYMPGQVLTAARAVNAIRRPDKAAQNDG